LVVLPRLLAQEQGAAPFRQAHTFQHQALFGDGAKISNGLPWILQVVEQTKAKDEIKLPQSRNLACFYICLFKRNSGKASARFLDVFRARIKSASVKTAFRKRLRKETHSATRIHGRG
jgi:hypothetical protein